MALLKAACMRARAAYLEALAEYAEEDALVDSADLLVLPRRIQAHQEAASRYRAEAIQYRDLARATLEA